MIRQVTEWDDAKDEIILYKLKPGKKSPLCNPHYYDKYILEEFYDAYGISTFPEVLEARLLGSFEFDDYGCFIKHKLIHEIPCWPLFTEELGVSWLTEKQEEWIVPKIEKEPKFWGIRPAFVMKKQNLNGIELAGGDLIFCNKLFNEPYEPKEIFQHVEFFSVLSNNILLLDRYIGKTKCDPYLTDCSEIKEIINNWHINFIEYFGYHVN